MRSDLASVLSCIQDPQNMPAPPAVMMQILMRHVPAEPRVTVSGGGWWLCLPDQQDGCQCQQIIVFQCCGFQQIEST